MWHQFEKYNFETQHWCIEDFLDKYSYMNASEFIDEKSTVDVHVHSGLCTRKVSGLNWLEMQSVELKSIFAVWFGMCTVSNVSANVSADSSWNSQVITCKGFFTVWIKRMNSFWIHVWDSEIICFDGCWKLVISKTTLQLDRSKIKWLMLFFRWWREKWNMQIGKLRVER